MLYLFDPTQQTLLYIIPAQFNIGWSLITSLAVPWAYLVSWMSHVLFGATLSVHGDLAGDTAFGWAARGCSVVLSLLAAAVWSWLAGRRFDHHRAHLFLRGTIRTYLAIALLVYGGVKAVGNQFGILTPFDLTLPLGEQIPANLLWRFMAASPNYSQFTGWVELIGGALMLSPRTTLLGALVIAAALTNVLALNLWYPGVGVIIPSLHLVLMALVLIAPDSSKLVDLLFKHRAIPATAFPPLFQRRWLERAFIVTKYGLFSFLALRFLCIVYMGDQLERSEAANQAFHGVWTVELQEQDGQVIQPLLTDPIRWRQILFQPGGLAIVRPMSGEDVWFKIGNDTTNHNLTFLPAIPINPKAAPIFRKYVHNTNAPPAGVFHIEQDQPDILSLQGTFGGQPSRLVLRQIPDSKFPLTQNRVRWIVPSPHQ